MRYSLAEAERLLPLIRSVGREVRERREAIVRLQRALESGRFADRAESTVRGSMHDHEAGVLRAADELEGMGLSVLRVDPLTVHIPGRTAHDDVVFCWQEGDDGLGHGHALGEEEEPRRPLRIRSRRIG